MAEKKYIIDNAELMAEWDWEKNNEFGFDPHKITLGSDKRVFWKCKNGHSWQTSVRPRVIENTKCPYCSGKKPVAGVNDLGTTHPELCLEWNYEKNIAISPSSVSKASTKKVWWKGKCGHEWQATVGSRTAGNGCPYCSNVKVLAGYNDLLTLNPEIAKEWHPTKNGNSKPQDFIVGSGKKVWWKCETCGYEWQTSIANRTKVNGTGCPKCKNEFTALRNSTPNPGESLFDKNPELAKEWHPTKNGDLTPKDVFPSSDKTVWWKCIVGHEWEATINVRNRGIGCIQCSKEKQTSYPEQAVCYYISKLFPDTINRYIENNKELDIYIPSLKIGIEYDGIFFHTSEKADKERSKDQYFAKKGIRVIRIKEKQSLTSDISIENDTIYYSPNRHYIALSTVIVKIITMIYKAKNEDVPELDISIERDNTQILQAYLSSLKANSVLTNKTLAKEWNYEKNGLLNPQYIPQNSGHKVWWKCEKGHEWQAVIASRNQGLGCPYCSNKKVLAGYNDLLTLNPQVASEWHPTKNGELQPQDFIIGSGKKVWWKCEICGYEWETSISNRTKSNGTGCPCCANKIIVVGKNDLATSYPLLAKQWDSLKNGTLTPFMVSSGSSQPIWWKCENGHEWQATVTARRKGSGCPYCAGKKVLKGYTDLQTVNPALAKEWNYEKNNGLTPADVMPNSTKKVWWKCTYGHEWEATISNRNKGRGCPICYRIKKEQRQINAYDAKTFAFIKTFDSSESISEHLGLDHKKIHRTITRVCRRDQKTLMGKYILRYASDDEFSCK